jgi:hypothetical protein
MTERGQYCGKGKVSSYLRPCLTVLFKVMRRLFDCLKDDMVD